MNYKIQINYSFFASKKIQGLGIIINCDRPIIFNNERNLYFDFRFIFFVFWISFRVSKL